MSHLPFSLMNRLNKACCFQTLDAVFPKDLFSVYFAFEDLPLSPTYEIWSVKMIKLILNTKIINISYLFICSIICSFISNVKVRSYEAI